MKVKAQMSMTFNLEKCIGCNTCTVACKNIWTNREGAEYMWWNNVETKPYGGYPQHWDQKILQMLWDNGNNPMEWYTGAEDKNETTAPYGLYNGDTIFELAQNKGLNQVAVGYIPETRSGDFRIYTKILLQVNRLIMRLGQLRNLQNCLSIRDGFSISREFVTTVLIRHVWLLVQEKLYTNVKKTA